MVCVCFAVVGWYTLVLQNTPQVVEKPSTVHVQLGTRPAGPGTALGVAVRPH